MRFTEEQFNTLADYEQYFRTAVNAGWASRPTSSALQLIHSIYTTATGRAIRLNTGCQNCILNLLRDCGRLYFRDKEEREQIRQEEENANPGKKVKNGGRAIILKTAQNGRKMERNASGGRSARPKNENARKRGKTTKARK